MQGGLKSRNCRIRRSRDRQSGYLLISLMLMFALMAIALLAILPDMVHQIKRDREQEMCRRGTQYMRAIQHFKRKMGSYPNKVEDLESTNNIRFLRRRYKDPLMKDAQGHDKDFKFLHMQDVMLNNGPMMGQAGGLGSLLGQGQAGALGQLATGLQGQGGLQGLAGLQGGLAQAGQMGGLGGMQRTASPASSDNSDSGSSGNSQSGSDAGSSGSGTNSGSSGSPSTPGGLSSGGSGGLSGQTFGGGPILGVASTSKERTIREYNKKSHYNEWYFIYDASMDRGGLLVGPWQPVTVGGAGGLGQPIPGQGLTGQGLSGQGQGFQSGFGGFGQQQTGFGQSPGGFGQGSQNPPAQNPNGNSPQN